MTDRVVRNGYVPRFCRPGRMLVLPMYAGHSGGFGRQYFHETQWSLAKEILRAIRSNSLVIRALSNLPSGLQQAVLFVSEAFGADQTLQKVSRTGSPVSDRSDNQDNQMQ
jgi:hypothetical protein